MITARNPMAPFWHVPQSDTDGETKFQLRGLTPLEIFDVHAGAETVGEQVKWTSRAIKTAIKCGMLDWHKFCDEQGVEVVFGKDVEANISRLGWSLTTEIFAAIMEASSLSEEQQKN